ncbi:MAG TPA: hypothetical protein VGA99_08805, partial [bacterium]
SEWERIAELISDLQQDNSLRFISPRQVLDFLSSPGAGQKLHLESPEQPVPVKKQGKYNLIRWAVTGRDDLNINTECWRIYQALKNSQDTTDADWRELCYLWSSDFRTHITDKRWHEYQQRFQKFWSVLTVSMPSAELAAPQVDIHSMSCPHALGGHPQNQQRMDSRLKHAGVTVGLFKPSKPKLVSAVKRQSDLLTLETELTKITLNPRRGLAIDGLWFKDISNEKLIGTLPHGFYDDISLGADFYSAHLIYEMPGHPKITDLNPVQPEVVEFSDSVEIKGEIQTLLGPLQKCFRLYHDSPRVELEYVPSWPNLPLGSLRLGLLTFYPTAFDRDTLYYRTCNGGFLPETFHVGGKKFEHGSPVSFLVSASHGLGVTDGLIEIGDDRCGVRVEVDKTKSALIAMIAYRELADSFFLRLAFSAREMDDTCLNANRAENCSRSFRIAISPITRTGNGKQQIH